MCVAYMSCTSLFTQHPSPDNKKVSFMLTFLLHLICYNNTSLSSDRLHRGDQSDHHGADNYLRVARCGFHNEAGVAY